jgi:hypothetical protein
VLQHFGSEFRKGAVAISTQLTARQYGQFGNPIDRVQTSQLDELPLTIVR